MVKGKELIEKSKEMIPYGFNKIHGDNVPNPLFLLKPPDGKEWKINWNKHEGVILFEKGWKEFAKYYSLAHGHMVLFEYEEETCHFGVHIFNKSNLEIKYPLHGSQDEQHNLNQICEENSVEIPNQQLPCKKRRPKSPMSRPQPRKKMRIDTSDDVGRSSKLANLPKHVQIKEEILDEPPPLKKKTRPESPMSCQPPKKSKANNSGHVGSSSKLQNLPKHVQVNGGKATQRTSLGINFHSFTNEAEEEANKFTSQNPFFTINIKPNRWEDHRQYMPIAFKRKYLDKKETMLLQFGKNLWPVKLISQLGRSTAKLSKGWVVFRKVSKLRVGDACVFELINWEDAVFHVHIFKGHSLELDN